MHPRAADEKIDHRAVTLTLVAFGAAAAFVALAVAVGREKTLKKDDQLRRKTAPPESHPLRKAAERISPLGKSVVYLPLAAAGASTVIANRHADEELLPFLLAAGAIITSGILASILNPMFDEVLPQPPAPPGREDPTKAVFPSGHAMGPGAILFTTAYALTREGRSSAKALNTVALSIPLVTAGARLLEEKHWASDILGGYLGAVMISATALAAYEAARAAFVDLID